MAVFGLVFFVIVLGAAIWAIHATIAPRLGYIAALLSGSSAAAVLAPVSLRRPVRRISPLSLRAELRLMRAAA